MSASSNRGPLNILLVEDDELQQASFKRAYVKAGLGYTLTIAGDGAEALDLLRSEAIPARCLVLLDIHMPRMGGLEFLRAVRADLTLKPLVVVMFSTSQDIQDQREALALNAAGFLLKSLDSAKLIDQLKILDQYWSMMEIP